MYNITDTLEPAVEPTQLRERCEILDRFVLDPTNGA
jgi:hypothetical protein